MNMYTKAVGAGILLCAIGFFGTLFSDGNKQTEQATASPQSTTAPTQVSDIRTLTLTATGDCTLATDVNFDPSTSFVAYADQYGTDWFFDEVRDVFSEDDLTLVNFEGTLTDRGEREDKTFAFRGSPEYVNILSGSSVEAASLANNHSMDYGMVSLEDTKAYLDEAGILHCRGVDDVTVTEINGIKVGLVGINYLNDQMKTELEDAILLAKSNGAELVILSIHWGVEKETAPNDEQIAAAHTAVDCGADIVIGTHPHVLQGVEKYKGRYIFYSLGNFCFGGNSSPSDMDTMLVRATFTLDNGVLCDDDAVEIIPCRISSASGYNNYQPIIAQGDEKQRITEKIEGYQASLDCPPLTIR